MGEGVQATVDFWRINSGQSASCPLLFTDQITLLELIWYTWELLLEVVYLFIFIAPNLIICKSRQKQDGLRGPKLKTSSKKSNLEIPVGILKFQGSAWAVWNVLVAWQKSKSHESLNVRRRTVETRFFHNCCLHHHYLVNTAAQARLLEIQVYFS